MVVVSFTTDMAFSVSLFVSLLVSNNEFISLIKNRIFLLVQLPSSCGKRIPSQLALT